MPTRWSFDGAPRPDRREDVLGYDHINEYSDAYVAARLRARTASVRWALVADDRTTARQRLARAVEERGLFDDLSNTAAAYFDATTIAELRALQLWDGRWATEGSVGAPSLGKIGLCAAETGTNPQLVYELIDAVSEELAHTGYGRVRDVDVRRGIEREFDRVVGRPYEDEYTANAMTSGYLESLYLTRCVLFKSGLLDVDRVLDGHEPAYRRNALAEREAEGRAPSARTVEAKLLACAMSPVSRDALLALLAPIHTTATLRRTLASLLGIHPIPKRLRPEPPYSYGSVPPELPLADASPVPDVVENVESDDRSASGSAVRDHVAELVAAGAWDACVGSSVEVVVGALGLERPVYRQHGLAREWYTAALLQLCVDVHAQRPQRLWYAWSPLGACRPPLDAQLAETPEWRWVVRVYETVRLDAERAGRAGPVHADVLVGLLTCAVELSIYPAIAVLANLVALEALERVDATWMVQTEFLRAREWWVDLD